MVVHWNAIPYYLGNSKKIRKWHQRDVALAGPLLHELAERLPNLRAVIPAGGAAQEIWENFAPEAWDVHVCPDVPHPSATNLNTRPAYRSLIVAAWSEALEACR